MNLLNLYILSSHLILQLYLEKILKKDKLQFLRICPSILESPNTNCYYNSAVLILFNLIIIKIKVLNLLK